MGSDLKDIVEPVVKNIPLSRIAGRVLAIDGNNLAYQFLSAIRAADGDYLRDADGNITSHLSGAFYRLSYFLENRIRLIVVFDGKPPEFKFKEIRRREEVKEEKNLYFSKEMRDEMKTLLDAMGVFTIIAPSEGEAQASYLTIKGKAYAVYSQDYDSFLFGASRVMRNYKDEEIDYVELETLLKHLNIDREKLILLGMLVGTDYNQGIRGIGVVKGLEMVKRLEKREILRTISEENGVDAEKIFEFFLSPPVEDVDVSFKPLDEEMIKKILIEKHGFSRERVEKRLEVIKEGYRMKTVFDL